MAECPELEKELKRYRTLYVDKSEESYLAAKYLREEEIFYHFIRYVIIFLMIMNLAAFMLIMALLGPQ